MSTYLKATLDDFGTKALTGEANSKAWTLINKQLSSKQLTVISAPPAQGSTTAALCLGLNRTQPFAILTSEFTKQSLLLRIAGLLTGEPRNSHLANKEDFSPLTSAQTRKINSIHIESHGVISFQDIINAAVEAKRLSKKPMLIIDNISRIQPTALSGYSIRKDNAHTLSLLKKLAIDLDVHILAITPSARSNAFDIPLHPVDLELADKFYVSDNYIILRRSYNLDDEVAPKTSLIMGHTKSIKRPEHRAA